MKVIKFGGSSLADGQQLKKVYQIVKADPKRRLVVVSAPGKRFEADVKVTDLLIALAEVKLANGDTQPLIDQIVARYQAICDEVNLDEQVIQAIRGQLTALAQDETLPRPYLMDAFKASGEDLNARLIAAYFTQEGLKARYVSPLEVNLLVSDEPGDAKILPEGYDGLADLDLSHEVVVFPGFYGVNKEGRILTFSRGGSDITGSILAKGIQAEAYENFTDVDSVFVAHPGVIDQPKSVSELTFREMRELSYVGFSVFHGEALLPAYQAGISVYIKNTNNPEASGTAIVRERTRVEHTVSGIATSSGFSLIYVSKYLMNHEKGFGRRLLQIFEDFDLGFEHMPSGIDDLTVVLRSNQLTPAIEERLIKRIEFDLAPDVIRVSHDICIVMIVGEEMRRVVGTAAKATRALDEAGVNIRLINQGASEVSMMFGIAAKDEEVALKQLYATYFG